MASTRKSAEQRRLTLGRRKRLTQAARFRAVRDARVRQSVGPLLVYALPNDLARPRLGLALSRRVGSAARRNRIKRLLREVFRHLQYDLPQGYDLVVSVRPHEPLPLAEYQRLLVKAAGDLYKTWSKKRTKARRDT